MNKEIKRTSQFKKDYKKAIKSGCKEEDFRKVLEYLVAQKPLPEKVSGSSIDRFKKL